MRMNRYLAVTILILSGNLSLANDSVIIRKMANHILTSSQAYENLRYLCKEIGPRLSGSANAQKAVEATARMLKDAGADTVYLQPCMVPHWVRGKEESGYVNANGKKRNLNLTALGNSVGSGSKGVLGNVIEVKDLSELQTLGENVRGKIVFINMKMDPTLVRTFSAYGGAAGGRVRGASMAAKFGATAVMVRSLASGIDDIPHTGVLIYNDSFPKIPAVAISTADAEWLSATLKSGPSVSAYFKTSCYMLPDVLSFNVIGEIRGSEYPEEIITVGGHLDSWDLGEGAQDDGAGCVQSIEIIRAFRNLGMKPRRTIRAVMFMNEENGGRGAQAYLQSAIAKKEKHLFALESDAGGFTPRGFGMDMTIDQMNKIISWRNLFDDYLVYDFYGGGGGADIGPLKVLGTALAGLSPDGQRYFDLHHASTDTFEAVSKRELEFGIINMAALVWLVSEYGL